MNRSFIKKNWNPDPPPSPVERPTTDTSHRLLTINQNNMFKDLKFSWEGMFLSLLWGLCLFLLVFFCFSAFSKKYVHRYTLGGDSSGTLKIDKEIDWAGDESISLDRNVTYSEALRMVDSLNRTLK